MKALKILVVVMGVLIVAGFAVIAAELVRRKGSAGPAATPAAAVPAPASTPAGAGPLISALPLPAGAAVTGLTATADRIVLRIAAPGEPDRLYLLDPASGAARAVITLSPAGTAP